ncbi:MAG: type VII toxin-antitoxin system MntA family adenylyltransferase antitoxin [Halanaerobiaceae bacterium]
MELPSKKLNNFCSKYNIKLMVVFGSYGTEMFNERSDIDLAVITEDVRALGINREEILSEVSSFFANREIDLVILNHADALLKYNVAVEGKLIYEKEEGLFHEFMVRAMSEHNDARKFYELDKKYIDNYIKESGNYGEQRVSPPQVE